MTATAAPVLHVPEEPTLRAEGWLAAVLDGAALGDVLEGDDGVVDWLWSRWRSLASVVDSRRSEGWATYSLPERTHTGATSLELPDSEPRLAAKLNLFDATMIVMGGIVGSGIFINPHVVAELLHTPALILATWLAGGAIALVAACRKSAANMRIFVMLTIRRLGFCMAGWVYS